MKAGDPVVLATPDNPRLDGARATVERLESWGAHVSTPAAATGCYRAAWYEMRPAPLPHNGSVQRARDAGYTGDICDHCHGSHLRRAGTCCVCEDCGATSGCG